MNEEFIYPENLNCKGSVLVIWGMLIHSFLIYSFPINFLTIDKWIKNFIWACYINCRKIVTMALKIRTK